MNYGTGFHQGYLGEGDNILNISSFSILFTIIDDTDVAYAVFAGQ